MATYDVTHVNGRTVVRKPPDPLDVACHLRPDPHHRSNRAGRVGAGSGWAEWELEALTTALYFVNCKLGGTLETYSGPRRQSWSTGRGWRCGAREPEH